MIIYKLLSLLVISVIFTACSYHNSMGRYDRFSVAATASLVAPSVTCVVDEKTGTSQCYAGSSIMAQLAQAAGNVAGGYLIGEALRDKGGNVSIDNANNPLASTNQWQAQSQVIK